MAQAFSDYYRGKTVLVTGHTGFKGSWLSIWLTHLGARVVGYALDPPTELSNFQVSRVAEHIEHIHADVLDVAQLQAAIDKHRPHIIFHLAAQSLVPRSIRLPRETFEVNIMGTTNVLDAALRAPSVQAVVAITSDKCYLNVGWEWPYRETDTLGGEEPYSASKAGAELVIQAYQSRGFQNATGRDTYLPIASTRAGNVVGGGDWAEARLIPDLARSIAEGQSVYLRSPSATRPWQHVLEPLSGYLWLGSRLESEAEKLVGGWNFGPADRVAAPVSVVVRKFLDAWGAQDTTVEEDQTHKVNEAMLLALDCNKAQAHLNWHANWLLDDTLAETAAWYRHFYNNEGADMFAFTSEQITRYTEHAREQGLPWIK